MIDIVVIEMCSKQCRMGCRAGEALSAMLACKGIQLCYCADGSPWLLGSGAHGKVCVLRNFIKVVILSDEVILGKLRSVPSALSVAGSQQPCSQWQSSALQL